MNKIILIVHFNRIRRPHPGIRVANYAIWAVHHCAVMLQSTIHITGISIVVVVVVVVVVLVVFIIIVVGALVVLVARRQQAAAGIRAVSTVVLPPILEYLVGQRWSLTMCQIHRRRRCRGG
jgi:hypothetical protein